MSDSGRERVTVQGEDDFERRLFSMIESGEVDFPKGAVRPGDETALHAGSTSWRDRLRELLPRLPRMVLTAAAAYAVALVAALPAYLVFFPSSVGPTAPVATEAPAAPSAPAPADHAAIGSARILDLGAGAVRAAGAPVAQIAIDSSDAFVVLSFLAPIRSGPGVVHQATITDASGRVVAVQSPVRAVDALGNFLLVCNARLFSPGDYELTLAESSAPGESHRFSFQVSRTRN